MIFITSNNFEEMNDLFKQEKQVIKYNIESQKKLKILVLKYMQNLVDFTSSDLNCASNILRVLENLKKSLDLCNNNISLLEVLLNDFENTIYSLKNDLNKDFAVKNYNEKYISTFTTIMQSTLSIEECLQNVEEKNSESELIDEDKSVTFEENEKKNLYQSLNKVENITSQASNEEHIENIQNHTLPEDIIENSQNQALNESINEVESSAPREQSNQNDDLVLPKIPPFKNNIEIELDNAFIDNTLVVSELTGKVTLPYSIENLEKMLKENSDKYSSVAEIVKKKYTLPISRFKNPFVSRFKEAYRLMREKEKASVLDALELGTELMFNYNLHPAIITACKGLDELDIYLDYLEDGETNKFNCFDIVFELPPAVVK